MAIAVEISAPGGAERDTKTWSQFAGASSSDEFCTSWLALQCSMIIGAQLALLLLRDETKGAYVPAATWPPERDITHLGRAAELVVQRRTAVTLGLDAEHRAHVQAGRVHVGYPVEMDGDLLGAVVVEVAMRAASDLQAIQRQLLWGAGWVETLLRRRLARRDAQSLDHAAAALDVLQAAHERVRLDEAAMAVVNDLATRCNADRVALGVRRKGALELRALSRTAWFDRKSQLVTAIESAMDETIDQETPIGYPPIPGAQGRVLAAHRELCAHGGAQAVLSVPLVSRSRPVGALTFERSQGPAFDSETIRLCELAGELLGPAVEAKLERERWLSGAAVEKVRTWSGKLLGPRHPTLKLATLLVIVLALFLALANGQFRIAAPTLVEGAVQRAAVAPFEAYIENAYVKAGDAVRQGQVLATFDDRDLKLEKIRWEAEKEQAAQKYREALAKHDRAASRALAAQLSQAEAQLALAEEKLARTQLLAPFDAVVVAGDLSQLLGSPVEQGKVLFELAPLDAYRVILKVDERDIAYVRPGQRGQLALTGLTHVTLPFTVKTVTSVSTAQEGRNFFRVEAQLPEATSGLRPGMEGIGKIEQGERKLAWIWTRGFIDWLRIALWTWLP